MYVVVNFVICSCCFACIIFLLMVDWDIKVQKVSDVRQSSNPTRSSKRTRAAEIHNLSEKVSVLFLTDTVEFETILFNVW